MSTTTKAGKGGGKPKNSTSTDLPFPLTPPPEGTDPTTLPFPVWSDHEINAEKWDAPKGKVEKQTKNKVNQEKATLSGSLNNNKPNPDSLFRDPQAIVLPVSLKEVSWKRPSELFCDAHIEVYREENVYPDLVKGSKHVLHSRFVRNFIAAVGILQYLGNTGKLKIIQTSDIDYIPTTDNVPWRPWHHIYSMNKVGKGQSHDPKVNPLGKYILRLFWMGCWRRVEVDDLIPSDEDRHPMLPSMITTFTRDVATSCKLQSSSTSPIIPATLLSLSRSFISKQSNVTVVKTEEMIIQLWPFLLAKGLIKLASLSAIDSYYRDNDFDIVECLTGWIRQKIPIRDINSDKFWDICVKYADNFKWPDEKNDAPMSLKERLVNTASVEDSRKSSKKTEKTSKTSDKSKKSKATNSVRGKTKGDELAWKKPSFTVIGYMKDLRVPEDGSIEDISPCWGHMFLIDQIRNKPLERPDPSPDFPFWKSFRWIDWSVSHGLITDRRQVDNIRMVKYTSPLRLVNDHIIYEHDEESTSQTGLTSKLSKSVPDQGGEIKTLKDLKAAKNKKNSTKIKSSNPEDSQERPEKSSKSNKTDSRKSTKSNKSSEKKTKAVELLPPDPAIWIDFFKISPFVSFVNIYFQSADFQYKVKVSDLRSKNVTENKKNKPSKKPTTVSYEANEIFVQSSLQHKDSRNEPLYVFVESLDTKFILFYLNQAGNTKVLDLHNKEPEVENTSAQQETLPVNTSGRNLSAESESTAAAFGLLMKFRQKSSQSVVNIDSSGSRLLITTDKRRQAQHARSLSHFVLEEYDWASDTSKMVTFLNTYGSKSTVLELGPGRNILKLWIKSETSFLLNVLSDTKVEIGGLEEVLESMARESHLLLNMSFQVASKFGQLVQKFGKPEYKTGLFEYYNSYKSQTTLNKKELLVVHDCFMEELINLLGNKYSKEEANLVIEALRILFFNPTLCFQGGISDKSFVTLLTDNNQSNLDVISTDIELLKQIENAIVLIQAFLRRVRVCFMKKIIHNPAHKYFTPNFVLVRKVYTDLFSVPNRVTFGPMLLRSFFNNERMDSIKTKYREYWDSRKAINIKSLTGCVETKGDGLFVLARYMFKNVSDRSVLVKIVLFCTLDNYMVRVWDNENNREMPRFSNNVLVCKYPRTDYSYTVLCYATSTECKPVYWKLCFVTLKEEEQFIDILKDESIITTTFREIYIPNPSNLLCRYFVDISQSCVITIRLLVSYFDARIKLLVRNGQGKIIEQISGREHLLLPSVFIPVRKGQFILYKQNTSMELLKKEKHLVKGKQASRTKPPEDATRTSASLPDISKKNNSVTYTLEAYVLEDTWPLNVNEWIVVNNEKLKKLVFPPNFSGYNIQQINTDLADVRTLKTNKTNLSLEQQPFWLLQIIYSVKDSVTITRDTARERDIKDLKNQWWQGETTRFQKSKKLRFNYIKKGIADQVVEEEQHSHGSSDVSPKRDSGSSLEINNYVFSEQLQTAMLQGNKAKSLKSLSFSKTDRVLKDPTSVANLLPAFAFDKYLQEPDDVDFESPNMKKLESEIEISREKQISLDIMNSHTRSSQAYIADMNLYKDEQLGQCTFMELWYEHIRQLMNAEIEKTYGVREALLKNIQEKRKLEKSSNQTQKKEKKNKKK